MGWLNFDAIAAAPLKTEPFDYFTLTNALNPRDAEAIYADYPHIAKAGSFDLSDAKPGPAVRQLIDELESARFRQIIEDKFGMDLKGRGMTTTLRGRCATRDGQIHTDSTSKLITVLIYLNEDWAEPGGNLRLLRNGEDLEAVIEEIPPTFGSMVVFRRSDNSWHGHKTFEGPRRVLQFNYVRSDRVSLVSAVRHRLSALFKRAA